jgi:N-acetylglucosaminyl-diphospho-decaprenol L-rhamnosyltransferase
MARPTVPTQLVATALPSQKSLPDRRRTTGLPRLSVIVVNYRQWDRTADLVRQLQASACLRRGDAEIVIVDNHSPPHPAARRLRRMAGVSVRRWEANHGFARAVNEGCRLSQGEWFLLLNPDTTLSEGFLDGALALADHLTTAEPRAGIVGFHLRNGDGSQQLSAGPFPRLTSTLWRLFLPRSRRKYHAPREPERSRVPWVTGCCMLMRRACVQDLDGLDEAFFLYYEDVDLCLRARQQGWSVWYEPNLAVVHHNPLHRRAVPAVLRMVTRHSLLTYAAKHWPRWQCRLLSRIVRTEAMARRLGAWWAGDATQSRTFREIGALAAELADGETATAQARIARAIRAIDVRVGV